MNGLIPAVNQFEFHGYWHEFNLVQYCQDRNIQVNSYAPLGTPDVTYKNVKKLKKFQKMKIDDFYKS